MGILNLPNFKIILIAENEHGKALKLYNSQTHSIAEITEATGVTKARLYRALKDGETVK